MEELFEASTPKYLAEIAPFDAHIRSIDSEGSEVTIVLESLEKETRSYYTSDIEMTMMVKKGDTVETKQILAK